jgi:hypothetical protein
MHTPGPWEFDGDYVWAESIKGYVADPQTEDILSGEHVAHSKAAAQWRANAKLIAAAPELLAALVAVLEIEDRDEFVPLTELDKAWTAARAAIAKAQGQLWRV